MKWMLALHWMTVLSLASVPPVKQVSAPTELIDDLQFENLSLAIERQLKHFNRRRATNRSFKLAGHNYSTLDLKKSLEVMQGLVEAYSKCAAATTKTDQCQSRFQKQLTTKFNFYMPVPRVDERGHKLGKTRYTAYYSPMLKGSRKSSAIYRNAVYKTPADSFLRNLKSEDIIIGKKLANQGLELFYLDEDLYDIWLLHVEGGGVVEEKLADGSKALHYLSYAGTNKKRFSMVSDYMVEKGYLQKNNRSIAAQKEFIKNNPHLEQEIIASCQSYVYFKLTKSEPLGVHNIPLTSGRSMATDKRLFNEYGFLNFVRVKDPNNVRVNISRFFINQDTGGAIRGNARGDLYMGYGAEAKYLGNNLHTLGDQYLMILKKGITDGK